MKRYAFQWLKDLIRNKAGIQIQENGEQMLHNRILHRISELGLDGPEAYCDVIQHDATGTEINTLIDAVTTNYTSFFRDSRQFDMLADFFEERLRQSRKKVRVWSAACSTGEELYSIAIVAHEVASKIGEPMSRFRILGTDIATSVLKQTAQGRFGPKVGVDITPDRINKYFTLVSNGTHEPKAYQVCDTLRQSVILRKFNLCDRVWNVPDQIDAIFCRNVLLYFDTNTQKRILANATRKLCPKGLLFIGASESVRTLIPGVEMEVESPSVFRKTGREPTSPEPELQEAAP